jgi:hypothetical protein
MLFENCMSHRHQFFFVLLFLNNEVLMRRRAEGHPVVTCFVISSLLCWLDNFRYPHLP